jgi:hypothetical protein
MIALTSRHQVPDDLGGATVRSMYRELWSDAQDRASQWLRRKDCRRPTIVRLPDRDSNELAFPIYGIRCDEELLTWAPLECGEKAGSCRVNWPYDYFAPRCAGQDVEAPQTKVVSDRAPTLTDVLEGDAAVTTMLFRASWGTHDGDVTAADTCALALADGLVVVLRRRGEDASAETSRADADSVITNRLLEILADRGLDTHREYDGGTSRDGSWAKFELYVHAGEAHLFFEAAAMLDSTETEPAILRTLEQLDATCTEVHRIVTQAAVVQQAQAPSNSTD